MTIFCGKCGQSLEQDDMFCRKCGTKVEEMILPKATVLEDTSSIVPITNESDSPEEVSPEVTNKQGEDVETVSVTESEVATETNKETKIVAVGVSGIPKTEEAGGSNEQLKAQDVVSGDEQTLVEKTVDTDETKVEESKNKVPQHKSEVITSLATGSGTKQSPNKEPSRMTREEKQEEKRKKRKKRIIITLAIILLVILLITIAISTLFFKHKIAESEESLVNYLLENVYDMVTLGEDEIEVVVDETLINIALDEAVPVINDILEGRLGGKLEIEGMKWESSRERISSNVSYGNITIPASFKFEIDVANETVEINEIAVGRGHYLVPEFIINLVASEEDFVIGYGRYLNLAEGLVELNEFESYGDLWVVNLKIDMDQVRLHVNDLLNYVDKEVLNIYYKNKPELAEVIDVLSRVAEENTNAAFYDLINAMRSIGTNYEELLMLLDTEGLDYLNKHFRLEHLLKYNRDNIEANQVLLKARN